MAKVSHDQAGDQAAAGVAEREIDAGDLDCADDAAKGNSQEEGQEAKGVDLGQTALDGSRRDRVDRHEAFPLGFNIDLENARHELDKKHHAEDAEQIGDAIACRDKILSLPRDLFGSGETRCAGKGAGHQTGGRGSIELLVNQNEQNRDQRTDTDRDESHVNIGHCRTVKGAEKLRSRDKADRGDKHGRAQIGNQIEGLFDAVVKQHDLLCTNGKRGDVAGKDPVQQRRHQDARRAQRNALDADRSEEIANGANEKNNKNHGKNAASQIAQVFHRVSHLHFLFLIFCGIKKRDFLSALKIIP